MLQRDVLLDTGPIVALLNPRDPWHEPSVQHWRQLGARCLTTEAVLTEACHLMLRGRQSAVSPLELVLDGPIPIVGLDARAHRRAADLMRRYADLPMDYADASLVTLAEALGIERVFTTDRRGFGTYRVGRRGFELMP